MKLPSVLIVSPYPTHPSTFGRSARLLKLIEAIRNVDWQPVLLFQDFLAGDMRAMRELLGSDFLYQPYRVGGWTAIGRRRLRNILQALPTSFRRWLLSFSGMLKQSASPRVGLDDWFDPQLPGRLSALQFKHGFKAVIAEDIFFSRALESFKPPVRRILDTHDLYALGRSAEEISCDPRWLQISAADERLGYLRADEVWAIQSAEAAAMRQQVPERPVRVVGHPVHCKPLSQEAALASRNLLFVASRHKHNVAALRWFASAVLPLTKSWLNPGQVRIVGDIDEVLRSELPFNFSGRVLELAEAYLSARVVICPVQSGSGLKIKAVEALAYGRPLVVTPAGAVGMLAGVPPAFLTAESPEQFARAIQCLMTEDNLCRELMTEAVAWVRRSNADVHDAIRQGLGGM